MSQPAGTLSALVVSVASVCRAPLAAAVFREVARARGAAPPWRTDSAGLDPWYAGLAVDPRVTSTLRCVLTTDDLWRQTTQKTRLVQTHDFQVFDYILAVDRETLEVLRTTAPGKRKSQMFLLPAFDPEKVEQILHPDYDEEGGFERCLHHCLRSCNGFLEHHGKNMLPL